MSTITDSELEARYAEADRLEEEQRQQGIEAQYRKDCLDVAIERMRGALGRFEIADPQSRRRLAAKLLWVGRSLIANGIANRFDWLAPLDQQDVGGAKAREVLAAAVSRDTQTVLKKLTLMSSAGATKDRDRFLKVVHDLPWNLWWAKDPAIPVPSPELIEQSKQEEPPAKRKRYTTVGEVRARTEELLNDLASGDGPSGTKNSAHELRMDAAVIGAQIGVLDLPAFPAHVLTWNWIDAGLGKVDQRTIDTAEAEIHEVLLGLLRWCERADANSNSAATALVISADKPAVVVIDKNSELTPPSNKPPAPNPVVVLAAQPKSDVIAVEMPLEARAMAMLATDRTLTIPQIANAINCHRTSLYKLVRFMAAYRVNQDNSAGNRRVVRGAVDGKTGHLEAWEDVSPDEE